MEISRKLRKCNFLDFVFAPFPLSLTLAPNGQIDGSVNLAFGVRQCEGEWSATT